MTICFHICRGFANNNLSGTLDIGTRYGNNLTLDLRNNSIKDFTQKTGYNMNISWANYFSFINPFIRAHSSVWGIMFYYILQAFWQPYLWWNRGNSQILYSSDFQWFLLIISELSSNVLQFRQNTKSYMQMFISIFWDTAFLFLVLLKFRELELLYHPCWLYDVCLFVQWASCGFSFSKWSNGWCLFISSNWSTNLSFNAEQFQSNINFFHWFPA